MKLTSTLLTALLLAERAFAGHGGHPNNSTMSSGNSTMSANNSTMPPANTEKEAGVSPAALALKLGWISWGYMLLVIVLRIAVFWTLRLAPKGVLRKVDNRFVRRLRKHVFLAPSVSYHHSTQVAPRLLGRFTFNIPTRDQVLILFGLFICAFVPQFVGYNLDPSATTTENAITICKTGGRKTGIMAIVLCPLFILFAGRNNFLLWLTGWPMDTFNVFHKWIGRLVIVLLSAHGLLYSFNSILNHKFAEKYQRPFYVWGTLAYIAGFIIFFQAMHFFRQRNYELFLYVHITMAIIFVFGAYYHLIDKGCHEFVYSTIAVWAFDRLMRVVRLLWSGVQSKAQCVLHGDVVEIKIDYSQRWKFYPGCYVFIHFKRWNRFWQSHPFTVIQSPKPSDDGKLVLFVRTKRGITKTIRNYLDQNGGSAESGVLIEGPYGPRYPVHRYDTIVCFAGGSGITGPYSHAVEVLKHPELQTRVVFVWTVSDEQSLIWFKDYLDAMRNDSRFEVILHVTSPSSTTSLTQYSTSSDSGEDIQHVTETEKDFNDKDFNPGRPQPEKIISEISSDDANGNVAVVVCGPGPMIDDVRGAVRNNMVNACTRLDYFEESFSW